MAARPTDEAVPEEEAASEAASPAAPPKKKQRSAMQHPTWSATFCAEARSEFERLERHYRVDIDGHRLTVLAPDGALVDG